LLLWWCTSTASASTALSLTAGRSPGRLLGEAGKRSHGDHDDESVESSFHRFPL
jgi:hypothetical protein